MIFKKEFNDIILPSVALSSLSKLVIYYLADKGTLWADEYGDYNHIMASFKVDDLMELFQVSQRQIYRVLDEIKNYPMLDFDIRHHAYDKKTLIISLPLSRSLGNESVGVYKD